jgi:hypothetical protein
LQLIFFSIFAVINHEGAYMQKQYVSNHTVNFSDFKFFVRPGDVCVHNEATNDFVIYRNGDLVATLKTSVMALKSMMTPETNYFSEIKEDAVPNVVVVDDAPGDDKITLINELASKGLDDLEAGNVTSQEDAKLKLSKFSVEEEGTDEDLADDEEGTETTGVAVATEEKGVTVTQVDLNEEAIVQTIPSDLAPPVKEVIVTKDPDKIKAIAEAQKAKAAKKPKSK